MSGLGTRRLVGWLAVLLAVLLIGGWINRDAFVALFPSLVGMLK